MMKNIEKYSILTKLSGSFMGILLTAVFTMVCSTQVWSQQPRLYTAQHGLSTSDIRSIYIDNKGVAWISGAGTLQMFDGEYFYDISLHDKAASTKVCDVVYGVEQLTDNTYLMRTSNGLFSYNHSTGGFTRIYLNDREKTQGGFSIGSIHPYPKSDAKLVITEGQGLYVLNTSTLEVDSLESARVDSILGLSFVIKAFTDSKGRLWVSDISNHIQQINLKTLARQPLHFDQRSRVAAADNAAGAICEANGKIFFGTQNGILCYDDASEIVQFVEGTESLNTPIAALLYTKDGNILVGTDSHGLWEMSPSVTDANIHKYTLSNNIFNLDYSKVKCLVQDKEGDILIGMLQKGLMVIPPHSDIFRYHAISPSNNSSNASCITSMAVDAELNYWIGTDGCGLFRTDGLHLATAKPINEGLRSLLVQDVVIDKRGTAWVGTYGGGVQCYQNGRFITPPDMQPITNSLIMALAYDSKRDMLYIGSNGSGVFEYDIQKQSLAHIDIATPVSPWVSSLHIDEKGVLIVGTVSELYYINDATGQSGLIQYGTPRSSTVQCITSNGNSLLFGTNEGLIHYNRLTAECTYILKDERVMAIEQTSTDYWVSTSSNILSIDKTTLKPTRYTSFGGFFIGEFHKRSSVHPTADDILFGGDNGIICYTPSLIKNKKRISNPLLFCELKTGDEKYASVPEEITLTYNQNSFSMSFSVPYFSAPDRIHYNYMLEGYDKKWHTCKGKPEVYYSSLPTGRYTLRIRAYFESEDELYEEKSLSIKVSAPWYGSFWAWIVYLVIIASITYFFYKAYKIRQHQQHLLRQARANEQLKEAKLRMFTSITHELRTPLTMILSPINQLASTYHDEGIQNLCNIMKRNCDRLLNIVKQITDIRHIDSGQLKLHFTEVDFVKYSENIFATFSANATLKNISFISECSDNVINIWIDPVQAEKIITNLLSNAFKFTPEGGKVIVRTNVVTQELRAESLERREERLELKVYNSGSSIAEEDIPHLYERFYQGKNNNQNSTKGQFGSGIGLNLVHEIVMLHHGNISVHNVEPDGVEFIVSLPLGNAHLTEEEMVASDIQDPNETTPLSSSASSSAEIETDKEDDDAKDEDITLTDNQTATPPTTEHILRHTQEPTLTKDSVHSKQKVLVVDDDKELCEYVSTQLGHLYNIIVAYSGNTAWQSVLQYRPDVIVTDVRMPDGDGIELCKRIKGNPETDNIPIIMLTSENSDDAQLHSLNLHVDYFLSKPFNLMILRGAIGQVLRVRENMRQRISRKDMSHEYDNVNIDSPDEKLFNKINEYVLRHLDDSEYGVEQLAGDVGLSRVHLNRKMKERYGMTPRQYIKSFRLKQAAYLLIHNNVNINEVVYKLGFSSHSFFTSSFHEYFGVTPKEFADYYSEHPDDETLKKLLE